MPADLPSAPEPPKDPRRGRLSITSAQQIVVSALVGAVTGYLLLVIFDLFNEVPPMVPWSLPIMLIAIAIPVFWYSRMLPRRIEKKTLPPEEGVRAMVLGKSMLMTGCVLVGGHLVYVLKWISHTDIPGPRERVISAAVTIVASTVFALVGALLERACVVDIGDGDNEGKGQPA